jgi:hypothetical protein
LDHLAVAFREDDWSVKRLIRRIVTSSVYRQSSDIRSAAVERDPENLLLWRAERRRLDFEAMRDSILAISGQLDCTVGGESVQIASESPSKRRTLYAFIDRQNLPGLFRTFDFASPDTHSPERPETIVPQQALYLMNNGFVQDAAQATVSRIDAADISQRVGQLYRLVLAREASPDELQLATQYIESDKPASSIPMDNPWQFGYGSLNVELEHQVSFQPLPHFVDSSWQGGPERPDPKLGWVILNASGGHAGNDQQHITIRRWNAQADDEIVVRGKLEHPSENGDGVRGRIVSSRSGLLGEWVAQHNSADTNTTTIAMKRGDTLDFLTDCRENSSHDSFQWRVTIRRDQNGDGVAAEWNSETGFHGPQPEPLGAWQRLSQTLMLTNEFLFLD